MPAPCVRPPTGARNPDRDRPWNFAGTERASPRTRYSTDNSARHDRELSSAFDHTKPTSSRAIVRLCTPDARLPPASNAYLQSC